MTNFYIERQKNTAKYYSEDLGNGIKLDMVMISEGKFIMGAPETELDSSDSERPQHEVTVPTFFMGRYPVTQEQWRTIMGNNPSEFQGNKRPVENVSWSDAKQFCTRLSEKKTRNYRLPSEAEWEYACRGISIDLSRKDLTIEAWNQSYHQPFHFGKTLSTELANYESNTTTEVGIFPTNQFGLCDMHGNILEWCEDDWNEDYQGLPSDGRAWIYGSHPDLRVTRGGPSILNPYNYCRSASRQYNYASSHMRTIGFRVVCEVPIQ